MAYRGAYTERHTDPNSIQLFSCASLKKYGKCEPNLVNIGPKSIQLQSQCRIVSRSAHDQLFSCVFYATDMVCITIWSISGAILDRAGSREGPQNQQISYTMYQNVQKRDPGTVPENISICEANSMQKEEAPKGKSNDLAPGWLQFNEKEVQITSKSSFW
jgi:hypothetical protein